MTPASEHAKGLIKDVFSLGQVGYVALESKWRHHTPLSAGQDAGTSEDTNFYEERLVNPTLIGLVSRRADLDCSGLRFIAI